jgi:cell division protein FtsL
MRKASLRHWAATLARETRTRLIIGAGLVCFLLLVLLAMVGERGFFEVYKFSRHLERVEQQIRSLEAENQRLRVQVAGLRTDPSQIEALAREDLGLAQPDELIFQIIDDSAHGGP